MAATSPALSPAATMDVLSLHVQRVQSIIVGQLPSVAAESGGAMHRRRRSCVRPSPQRRRKNNSSSRARIPVHLRLKPRIARTGSVVVGAGKQLVEEMKVSSPRIPAKVSPRNSDTRRRRQRRAMAVRAARKNAGAAWVPTHQCLGQRMAPRVPAHLRLGPQRHEKGLNANGCRPPRRRHHRGCFEAAKSVAATVAHPMRLSSMPDADGFREVHSRRRWRRRLLRRPHSPRPVLEDLVGLCFNCLQEGHVKAGCSFVSRCRNCRCEGHRARCCPLQVSEDGAKRARPPSRATGHARRSLWDYASSFSGTSASSGRSPPTPQLPVHSAPSVSPPPQPPWGGTPSQHGAPAPTDVLRWASTGGFVWPLPQACSAIQVGSFSIVAGDDLDCFMSHGEEGTPSRVDPMEFEAAIIWGPLPRISSPVTNDVLVTDPVLAASATTPLAGEVDFSLSGPDDDMADSSSQRDLDPAMVEAQTTLPLDHGVNDMAPRASASVEYEVAPSSQASTTHINVATLTPTMTIDDFISRYKKLLDQPIILSPSRLRITRDPRARSYEELIPRRSARLAAKSKHREQKSEAQARKVMMKRFGFDVETEHPDEASFEEFQTAFAVPLTETAREALQVFWASRARVVRDICATPCLSRLSCKIGSPCNLLCCI